MSGSNVSSKRRARNLAKGASYLDKYIVNDTYLPYDKEQSNVNTKLQKLDNTLKDTPQTSPNDMEDIIETFTKLLNSLRKKIITWHYVWSLKSNANRRPESGHFHSWKSAGKKRKK